MEISLRDQTHSWRDHVQCQRAYSSLRDNTFAADQTPWYALLHAEVDVDISSLVMPSVFWPKFLNIMSLTVVRYQDKRSRHAVESALKAIMSSNPKSDVQEFRSALTKIISKLNAELIRPATVEYDITDFKKFNYDL